MALSGQYDEARLVLEYFAVLPRVGTMVDVGAHFGSSLRPYLDLGWRVLAFEPDATKHTKLKSFENRPHFKFRPDAVGEAVAANVQFFTSPESTGIASLVPFRPSHEAAEQVRVTTLAAALAEEGIRSIDFLKIDTEGYDLPVLRGHDWSVRPEVVLCEFDELKTRPIGHGYHAHAEILQTNGYAVWMSQWAPIVRYGGTHAWHSMTRYPAELHHPDAWGNFIAVREDADVAAMQACVARHQSA